MKYGILPNLTRDYILSRISEEQIFEYYLGIKVETGVLLPTPHVIRPGDRNPTFSFKYSDNGKLRARDWAGYFWGDCFDLVAHVLRLNSRDKKSFNLILDQIARDFRLHKYAGIDVIETGNTYDVREVVKKSSKTLIQFTARNWDKAVDGSFWLSGNINSRLLDEGRVYPCQSVWINNNINYNFNPKDPAYAYKFTHSDIKVYFPKRKEWRFLSNTSYLQGIDLLQPARIGLVTKSYKDVLSLRSYGIQAVAPSSEVVPIKKDEWWKLRNTCDHWFSLMDFDRTGILMARKLRLLYNIRPIFLAPALYKPLHKGGQFSGVRLGKQFPSYIGVKDFFDLRKARGNEDTLTLIEKVKEHWLPILDEYDQEVNNDLKWIHDTHKSQKLITL